MNGTKEFSPFFTFIPSLIKAHVKINKALDILKLDKLPFSKETIDEAYNVVQKHYIRTLVVQRKPLKNYRKLIILH